MVFDKYIIPIPGIKVLVVDADSTCLALVSKMLRTLGYEGNVVTIVLTARLAYEALSIIEKNELHLVLMENHLPDMEMYGLIEIIRECYDIPSFIMSADDDEHSMVKALCKGAKLCFRKPVVISDLKGLWQFALWERKDRTIVIEDVSKGVIANKDEKCQPPRNEGKRSLQISKGKEKEPLDKDKGGEKNEPSVQKRNRITWTNSLQKKFLEAFKLAGVDATPKRIHEFMNVPGITKQHVSSYLQKYRQTLKQQADEMQQYKNRPPSDSNLESLLLSWKGFTSCMSMQFLGTPSYFPSLQIPSVQESPFGQNQLCLQGTLQGVAHGTSSGFGEFNLNGNGEALAEFSQVENATNGSVFNEVSLLSNGTVFNKDALLSNGSVFNEGVLLSNGSVFNGDALLSNGSISNEGALLSNGSVFNGDALLSNGSVSDEGALLSNGSIFNKGALLSNGRNGRVFNGDALLSNGSVSDEGALLSNGSVLNESTLLSNGSVLNEGALLSNGRVSNEGALLSNGSVLSEGAFLSNGSVLNEGALPSNGSVLNEDALLSCVDYITTTKPCLSGWDRPLGSDNASCVDYTTDKNEMQCSTLLTNDMPQQFAPQLPVQPAPSYEKELDIFEAEAANIDDIFDISTETQQIFGEDLDTWLSRF